MLLAVLGLTRLLVPDGSVAEIEIREVEIAALPEPPPPPPEEPPPDAPPPPPSLTDVSEVPDPTRVPVPKAEVPMDLTMPVDPFFTDVEPAPLPKPIVRRAPPRPQSRPAPKSKAVNPPPAPVAKSYYGVNELDGKPRLLRHGSAAFPSALARKGVKSGTVTFEVELSTSGSVRIRRVLSSTHSELVSAARRVASSARFTAPTRNGQRVKAVMKWPITIRK
jgi:TonB family protein